jgi:hypothetical protein
MGWYLLQIAAGLAAAFGVYVGFFYLGLDHVPYHFVIGAAFIGALFATIVVNRICRLRELARVGGKGYFRTWFKEVMAAEEFLPPGAKR